MDWLWQNAVWIGLVWSALILLFVLYWGRLCKLNELPDIEDVNND